MESGRKKFRRQPSGAADVELVGSLVAGAAVALELDKCFKQHGTKSVACEPVRRQLAGGKSA